MLYNTAEILHERLEHIRKAAAYVKKVIEDNRLQPEVGIVLGSGLGRLGEKIKDPVVIPYRDIPGFPVSTAIGHKGNFLVGELGGKTVIAMQGRIHYYEGYPMEMVTLPIRVMILAGIKALFVSNAAGGVNYDFHVGDLMIIRDHINQLPNPLIGPNMDEFGPRFPDMTRPYDLKLIALAKKLAAQMNIPLKEGVYYGDVHHPRGYRSPPRRRARVRHVRHHQRGARRLCRGLCERRRRRGESCRRGRRQDDRPLRKND